MGVAQVTDQVDHSIPPRDTAKETEWGVIEFGHQGVTCRCLVLESCHHLNWWQSCVWDVIDIFAACGDVNDPRLLGCGAQDDG